MKRYLCLILLTCCISVDATPVDTYFSQGVLGMRWGATLEEVQTRFPDGFTWQTAKIFTDFVHEDRIDTKQFGVEARDLPVQFGFNEAEKLKIVHFFYGYDGKEDLLYKIAESLGQDYATSSSRYESRFTWSSKSRVQVVLSIGHRPPHKWAVLSIYPHQER